MSSNMELDNRKVVFKLICCEKTLCGILGGQRSDIFSFFHLEGILGQDSHHRSAEKEGLDLSEQMLLM